MVPWQPEGAHFTQAAVLQHVAQITMNTNTMLGQELHCLGLSQNVVDVQVVAVLDPFHSGMQGCRNVDKVQQQQGLHQQNVRCRAWSGKSVAQPCCRLNT